MSQHNATFGHKLGSIPYKPNTSQFSINGVAEFTGHLLFE
ncbi:hypothetical protein CSC04_1908 [Enterobacter roggenkampii]|nr:hypothetical protein CSC04_1908 [Enterobacter roggenkampii]